MFDNKFILTHNLFSQGKYKMRLHFDNFALSPTSYILKMCWESLLRTNTDFHSHAVPGHMEKIWWGFLPFNKLQNHSLPIGHENDVMKSQPIAKFNWQAKGKDKAVIVKQVNVAHQLEENKWLPVIKIQISLTCCWQKHVIRPA